MLVGPPAQTRLLLERLDLIDVECPLHLELDGEQLSVGEHPHLVHADHVGRAHAQNLPRGQRLRRRRLHDEVGQRLCLVACVINEG